MSGFFITRKSRKAQVGEEIGWRLLSDFHLGSAHCDEKAIRRDLQDALEAGDRIAINGDVFDLILPSDLKRFKPDALDKRLLGRVDILNATLELGVELLAPYANQIDMIGIGNHESSMEKHHSADLVLLLLDRLAPHCKDGHVINYGGYTGFLSYSVDVVGGARGVVIYYHHGSGGTAAVTHGIIDFQRKAAWVDSDVIWQGHKHNKLADTTGLRLSCPKSGDDPRLEQQVWVMTGGYLDTMKGQSQDSVKKRGRLSCYSSDWGLAPQAKGGARLIVDFDRNRDKRVRILQ